MGMYTAVRCRAKIKPEFHQLVADLIDACVSSGGEAARLSLRALADKWPQLSDLAACERGSYIFSWMTVYGFDGDLGASWEPDDPEWEALVYADGSLRFQASIKNYDDEFTELGRLLEQIAEKPFYLKKWYEEECSPRSYLGSGVWDDPVCSWDDTELP